MKAAAHWSSTAICELDSLPPGAIARAIAYASSNRLPWDTEMALHVLAHNLTRVMNIVGVKPLIAAIQA